jgi:hypothetical protein
MSLETLILFHQVSKFRSQPHHWRGLFCAKNDLVPSLVAHIQSLVHAVVRSLPLSPLSFRFYSTLFSVPDAPTTRWLRPIPWLLANDVPCLVTATYFFIFTVPLFVALQSSVSFYFYNVNRSILDSVSVSGHIRLEQSMCLLYICILLFPIYHPYISQSVSQSVIQSVNYSIS